MDSFLGGLVSICIWVFFLAKANKNTLLDLMNQSQSFPFFCSIHCSEFPLYRLDQMHCRFRNLCPKIESHTSKTNCQSHNTSIINPYLWNFFVLTVNEMPKDFKLFCNVPEFPNSSQI
jgi:hypothetical protein